MAVGCLCTGGNTDRFEGDRLHSSWGSSSGRGRVRVHVHTQDSHQNVPPICQDGRGAVQLAGSITGRNCVASTTRPSDASGKTVQWLKSL